MSTPKPERVMVCGTRAVLKMPDGTYRVACATCGAVGAIIHTLDSAGKAAIRDSGKACRACGAA